MKKIDHCVDFVAISLGAYNGGQGWFESIFDQNSGRVTHRIFALGGSINGIPHETMMQSVFDRISQYELVDWAVVLQGVCGIPGHLDALPTSCVESFASAELERISVDDPMLDVLSSLAVDSDMSASELCSHLKNMYDYRNADMQRARQVWRAAALGEVLKDVESDPLYGLIKLSEFWAGWGWPYDAPLSMRLDAKLLQGEDYHSAKNYDHVVREHVAWLQNEWVVLRAAQEARRRG